MNDPTIAGGMGSNRHPLDEASAARLLQGAVHPDDAPPGYAAVAGLLATAASPAAVDEDAGATTISAMVEAIRGTTAIPEAPRKKSMIGKLLAGKALVAVALALTAGGAAAATGTLPGPVQGVVSDAVSLVGVDIPHPNHGKSAGRRQDGENRQDGKNDQSGEDQDQRGNTEQPNPGQVTSGAAHDAKTGATEAGDKVGPAVCTAVGSKCPGKQDPASGSDDEGTPPNTPASDDDQGGQGGKSGDDHGRADDHTTPPTTGSIATGEDHSGRDLPPSDNGKAGKQDH